jgi:hypothetical protein
MRKSSLGFALTAAAGAVVLAATPALAATWTVSGGGPITGTAITNIVTTDTVTGKQVTCTASNTSGTLTNGTNLSNPLGSITSVTFSSCSGLGFSFTSVVASGTSTINGDSYDSTTGVTTGHISGIHIELQTNPASNCDLILDGTGGGNTGVVSGTYDNTSGVFTLNSKAGIGDTLVATVVAGCVGLTQTGDAITVAGDYSVTNSSGGIPQITSP